VLPQVRAALADQPVGLARGSRLLVHADANTPAAAPIPPGAVMLSGLPAGAPDASDGTPARTARGRARTMKRR